MSVLDDRTSRRRTLDVPTKPETGLAEWTSKIKALQRQVDEDDEEETKRLEKEIAASRLARLRRSTGASRGNSVDLSKGELVTSLKDQEPSAHVDDVRTSSDREKIQDDALKKLMGDNYPHRDNSSIAKSSVPPPAKSSSPMSLAAFIGGRATGPRLTRQAPQPDAHDPTQFEQRTHITSPHPILGRGGVAMPGMAGKGIDMSSYQYTENELAPAAERDRTISTPSIVKSFVGQVEGQRAFGSQKTGGSAYSNGQSSRQRTISTPTGLYPQKNSPRPGAIDHHEKPQPERSYTRPLSRSPAPSPNDALLRSTTPSGRHTPSSVAGAAYAARASSTSPLPHSPTISHTPPPYSPSPASPANKHAISTPSLSRPIQPQPRHSLGGPQLSASLSPSAAFLRPSPQKDPTPSISRLQGRGFVQNMVRASTQLEASVTGTSHSPRPGEKGQDSGRKASVLDRWQFDNGKGSRSSSPPIVSPKPAAMRRSQTVDPSATPTSASPAPTSTPPLPKIIKPDYTGKSLKSVASLPSMSQSRTSSRTGGRSSSAKSEAGGDSPRQHGLGSSTTVISYIKPTKTGETQITTSPPSRPPSAASRSHRGSPEVDELGMRVRQRAKSIGASMAPEVIHGKPMSSAPGGGGSGGKPLSHPTKDRARKPRKAREATKEAVIKEEKDKHDVAGRDPGTSDVYARMPLAPTKTSHSLASAAAQTQPVAHTSTTPTLGSKLHDSTSSQNLKVSTAHQTPEGIPHSPRTRSPIEHHKTSPSPSPVHQHPYSTSTPISRSTPLGPPLQSHVPFTPTLPQVSSPVQPVEKPPASPIRHTRIPSTGNRATVMDVAQALSEHERAVQRLSARDTSNGQHTQVLSKHNGREHTRSPSHPESNGHQAGVQSGATEVTELERVESDDVMPMVANRSPRNGAQLGVMHSEKRRSSYEKYSAFIMPPLEEEKTPVHSPADTLNRTAAVPRVVEVDHEEEHAIDKVEAQLTTAIQPEPVKVEEPVVVPASTVLHIATDIPDEPLPSVDIDALIQSEDKVYKPNPDLQSISVDVMSIIGTTATAITRDTNIFYDSESLVIIHRSKTKSSGLVGTTVWSWQGRGSEIGEREERKMQELARRYNTALVHVRQYGESSELVSILGGQLAIRQGTRTHWSTENTAMHLVRSVGDIIYIDELDLNVRNLCSGFSYCLSLLQTFYVWYGRGSITTEKQAALSYAQKMAPTDSSVIELIEGETDDDEMFWLMLGERDYAKAEHWRWRPSGGNSTPRIWRINLHDHSTMTLEPIVSIRAVASLHDFVYVIDCIWEYFVLVGREARGKRSDIKFALTIAIELSTKTGPSKPFSPTVHVLVLPTQIPSDLRLVFRDIDEVELNYGQVPDHMNLIPAHEALQHLHQTSWEKVLLQDPNMLPVGVDPSHLGLVA